MTNLAGFGSITGRAVEDIYWFPKNADGSMSGRAKVAVDDNFKRRDGKIHTNYLPVNIFVPAEFVTSTPWLSVGKGDLIQVGLSFQDRNYFDKKAGKMVYRDGTDLIANAVKFLEPKETTAARRAKYAAEGGETTETVAVETVTEVPASTDDEIAAMEARLAALQDPSEAPF